MRILRRIGDIVKEQLIELYSILLTQYGTAGKYQIDFDPKPVCPYVIIKDEWDNIIVQGEISKVLHQARQW